MLNEDCPKISGDFLFDPQTLYQENIDQEKSGRRITEQPLFGTNNLPEAPAVSLLNEDLSKENCHLDRNREVIASHLREHLIFSSLMNVSNHMISQVLQPSGTRGNPAPSSSHGSPLYVQPSAAEAGATAALLPHKRPDRNVEHAGSTVFDKVMEQLTAVFPHHTRFILL